ncbi:MAG: Uma2 family endonuclease [candidate division KSB1 bacterium]|nr:Uma2 family endonuclease [candidate division KSB1 bacterium]
MSVTMTKPQEVKKRYTYQDYCALPDDRMRYEIINGELFMTPAPTTTHQRISRNLEAILWDFIEENNLGEIFYAPYDVVFSNEDVMQPDLVFVSKENSGIITEDNIQGAPDLIVEITSPTTERMDRLEKKVTYERFGVKEYWIVDSKKNLIEVWTLLGVKFKKYGVFSQHDILTSPLLKGLAIELNRVFA